jgi:queuine tRNA-ribosyltransferase
MVDFKIVKKSEKSKARLGILKTDHGLVETPAFVPVATQGVVKTLNSDQAKQAGCQLLIANTFHLHNKPGEEIIAQSGGLHKFMNWDRPLMTDSTGFQVFSLGFGSDLKVGKLLKYFPGENENKIMVGQQPNRVKIMHDGVLFRSLSDGKDIFIGPKESMRMQAKIGADMIFAFDECTAPLVTYEYAKVALSRTHRWIKVCLEEKDNNQALFGIVQGSRFKDLREESAKYIGGIDGVEGFGVGGDLGNSKEQMMEIISWAIPYLPEEKPRHLLGIGYLEDMQKVIEAGIDLFDCTVPTHYARRGFAFTKEGRLDLSKIKFMTDQNPLDVDCRCETCLNYKRNYISHLVRADEWTGSHLLTIHNLFYFNNYVKSLREKIKQDEL